MLKKSIFLTAVFALAVGAQAAKAKVLYNSQRTAMYKYAFPEGQSQITEVEKSGRRWMTLKLKGDAWAGAGLGIDRQRLQKYHATGALQFYVRGAKGGESFDIGFVMAKGLKAEDLAYQILLPLGRYGKVTKKWTKVVVPLRDFPAEGTRWLESENRNAKGIFKWNRTSEFVVSRAPSQDPWVTFAISDVMVVPNFDAAAVKAAVGAATKISGPVTYFDGAKFSEAGGGMYTYPPGESKYTLVGGRMKVELKGSAWSGGGIFCEAVDLSDIKDKGSLKFTATGEKGKEVIFIGLVDKANGASLRVSINPYLPGGLKAGEPSTITVPLADFPAQGSKWDEAAQKNLTFDFDWTQVSEVLFDNNGPNNGNDVFYINKIQVIP